MGCCGQDRRRMRGGSAGDSRRRAARDDSPRRPQSAVYFQYQGRTRLTAVAPGTGRRYVFGHPGAIQRVDPRDRRALLAVPRLRQVRHP